VRRDDFRAQLVRGDSYGLLLALIVVTYMSISFLDFDRWGRIVLTVLYGLILLLALHTSHFRGRLIRVAWVVVVLSVGVAVAHAFVDEHRYPLLALAGVVILSVTPIVVLIRILAHDVVGLETILGAICAYLLIGMVFAAWYLVLNAVDPPFFAQPGRHNGVDYLYFSFVVQTTLGFGDLTPVSDAAKVTVTMEALIGQIFLVTLVARLVGAFGTSTKKQAA
jgi:hypothetical protein